MGVWWKLHNEVEGDGQGWEAAAMVKERQGVGRPSVNLKPTPSTQYIVPYLEHNRLVQTADIAYNRQESPRPQQTRDECFWYLDLISAVRGQRGL